MRKEETVTSPLNQYTTSLEVRTPDGHHVFCDLTLEGLTGSLGTDQGWFWMSLLNSLVKRQSITVWEEEVAFLQRNRQGELPF